MTYVYVVGVLDIIYENMLGLDSVKMVAKFDLCNVDTTGQVLK